MDVKKIGPAIIVLLIVYLVYDRFLSTKEFLPNVKALRAELSLAEESLLEQNFNAKKKQALLKQVKALSADYRLYQANPASRVQSQIRTATAGKLKVFSFSGGSQQLKPLNKDEQGDSTFLYMDTTVNAQNLTVEDVKNIMTKLRQQRPRLEWKSLSINSNNPNKISLNGSLRAFFLSEELSLALKGGQK